MQTFCRWLVLLVVLIPSASARDLLLKWSEVAAVAVGYEVQLKLAEGATVRGQALAVREDFFEIDIRETSNKALFPKGRGSIPRASVSVVEVRETHGVGRVTGTVVGLLVGVVVGGALLDRGNRAAAAGGAVLAFGMPVGGYYYGKSIDHKVTRILIEH